MCQATFVLGNMNIWIPLDSRGRPLCSTNKTFMMVWKPSLSTFCTASKARFCILQWVHMLKLSHGQQLFRLLNKVRKQSAADPGDEILHSSFLGRERRTDTLPGRKKGLEGITWIIESIPCPQPGNILLDQRTLLFPTLQNPQNILQHLIIIPRPLLQKELWKIFLASSQNRNFVLSIKMQRSFLVRAVEEFFPEPIMMISLTGYKNKREQTGMREMSSAPVVPDQCQRTTGKGEGKKKRSIFYSANEKVNVLNISSTEPSAPGPVGQLRSCFRSPKMMVKSHPRPTRWHCGWRYQHLRTQAEFSSAWQLQSRLRGSDFQRKSLCLEPHSAVLPIQQLFGTLSPSGFRLFQITISILGFFCSRSSTIIFFHFLKLPQNIPEVSRNI